MRIQVRLHGALSRYRPAGAATSGAFELEVVDGATIATVIEQLGIPAGWVRGRFVNERACELWDSLVPGDQLVLLPPVGGGADRGTRHPPTGRLWYSIGASREARNILWRSVPTVSAT